MRDRRRTGGVASKKATADETETVAAANDDSDGRPKLVEITFFPTTTRREAQRAIQGLVRPAVFTKIAPGVTVRIAPGPRFEAARRRLRTVALVVEPKAEPKRGVRPQSRSAA